MLRHFWEVFGTFREVARQFVTAFCIRVGYSILAIVGVRLKKNKNDVMKLGERPRSLEGKPNITGTDRD